METAQQTDRLSVMKISESAKQFVAMTAAVAAILMIPAIMNGSPFIFFDSDQYFTVGQRIFETLFGVASTPGELAAVVPAGTPAATAAAPDAGGGLAALAGGRAPTYSFFLYLVSALTGLWGVAALQSLICAVLIVRFWQLAWGTLRWGPVLLVATVLSFLNGLGFHATFMMPDVFSGCIVLALAIFLYFKPAGRIENILLIGGSFIMSTLHTTNLLLVVCALIAAMLIVLAERKPVRPLLGRLGVVAGIAVATVAFNAAYVGSVKFISGDQVRSPPYLMARMLGDGTGEAYLSKHCAGDVQPFAACVYAGIDFYNHDAFLWEPRSGGFQTADNELRAALSAEEMRFVVAVIAADPGAQLAASFGNFVQQIAAAGLQEIHYGVAAIAQTDAWNADGIVRLIPGAQACKMAGNCVSPTYGDAWSSVVQWVNLLVLPVFAFSAVWLFTIGKSSLASIPDANLTLLRVAFFVALMMLANAAICGVLSSVNNRYQARIIWSLALAMFALAPVMLTVFQSQFRAGPETDRAG